MTLSQIVDDPQKDTRLHNAHVEFSLLCKGMRMSEADLNGLWNYLAVYGTMTNYNFPEEPQVFYQRCTSIHRDVEFTFKIIGNVKTLRLILDVVS